MAVVVTRTMASWGFVNLGSGTFSTRTSCLPYQQSAFIMSLLSASGLAFTGGNFTAFHESFEPEEIVGNLFFCALAGNLCPGRAELPSRRLIAHLYPDHSSAPSGRRGKPN